MLKVRQRLRKNTDFSRVYKNGKTLSTKLFFIKTAKNDLKNTRFGVVLSNKVIKKAVQRNKKKRQIRNALLSVAKQTQVGYDVVICVKPDIALTSFAEIKKEITQALIKIHFLKN